jgi:hypothetical protein
MTNTQFNLNLLELKGILCALRKEKLAKDLKYTDIKNKNLYPIDVYNLCVAIGCTLA